MDIITEAREYLECHPLLSDGTYFAEHNNLIKALLTKLEEKEREAAALEDALKKANLCCCDNEEKNKELKAEVKERWQTDTIKNKQINKLLAENERLMGVVEASKDLFDVRTSAIVSVDDLCARQKIYQEALASLHKEKEE